MNTHQKARVWKPLSISLLTFSVTTVLLSVMKDGVHSTEAGVDIVIAARFFSATFFGLLILLIPVFGIVWVTKVVIDAKRLIGIFASLGCAAALFAELLPDGEMPKAQSFLELVLVQVVVFIVGVWLLRRCR